MNLDFIKAADFFENLKKGSQIYFFVRHGERGEITRHDKDYGSYVMLTEKGKEQAYNFGQILPKNISLSLFASPVGRCMQTAEFIGKGFGQNNPIVNPLIPLAEFFVKNKDAYNETLKQGFCESILSWICSEKESAVFFNVKERSQELLDLMLNTGKSDLNIFVSHDAWVIPALNYFCKLQFSLKNWMNFLTGLMVVKSENDLDFYPVTALESGWLKL